MTYLIPRKYGINREEVKKISSDLKLDEMTTELLFLRGIDTKEKISLFLSDSLEYLRSPEELSNISEAAEAVLHAIRENQTVVIYGDYDCDGIGATAILYQTIKHLGGKAEYYIPQRHEEGYGLNIEAVTKIYEEFSPGVLLTVDCGISAVCEVDYAVSLGIKVIITDHHECPETLPSAVIVNPKLNPSGSPLCGAGVAFKLAQMLTDETFPMRFLDICAVSTIADMVPLTGDNRIIVKHGLKMLSSKTGCKGLTELMKAAGSYDKKDISTDDAAFKLAPRLNAAGRLSTAYSALELLISGDEKKLPSLALYLNEENKKRQDACADIIEQCFERLKGYDLSANRIIVLEDENWEEGVIGIAAAKIVETFLRPAILLKKKGEYYKGSGRSIKDINLFELLVNCSDSLSKFGGHSMAAGVTLHESDLENFKKAANEYLHSGFSSVIFEMSHTYDIKMNFCDINAEILSRIELLRPFGHGNPSPVFIAKEQAMRFAPMGNKPHLKEMRKNAALLAFNKAGLLPVLNSDTPKYLLYSIEDDSYNGGVQCVVKNAVCEKVLNFNSVDLLGRYLNYFSDGYPQTDASRRIKPAPAEGAVWGTLYVAFNISDFNSFVHKNPAAEQYIFHPLTINPYNAAVLLPDLSFGYAYYNKICFLRKPPEKLLNHIKSRFGGVIEESVEEINLTHFKYITTETLRRSYSEMLFTVINRTFGGYELLYKAAKASGYTLDSDIFIISYHIFKELGLLYINDNGIIKNITKKVSLDDSAILQKIWKRL